MREIIFRGKSKESGEWIYGVPCYFDDSRHIVKYLYNAEGGYVVGAESEEVIPDTIGQYTGLKDANGTKIFEGDIVESRASENKEDWKYWQVIFYDGSYCFEREVKKRKYKYEQNLLCEDEVSLYGLVVVGNIHDNPELLEGVRE